MPLLKRGSNLPRVIYLSVRRINRPNSHKSASLAGLELCAHRPIGMPSNSALCVDPIAEHIP